MKRREMIKGAGAVAGLAWMGLPVAGRGEQAQGHMRVAAGRFATVVEVGAATHGRTGAKVQQVAGPLMTTVMLLDDGGQRVCIIASDFRVEMKNIVSLLRAEVARLVGTDPSNVLLFASHDHGVPHLAKEEVRDCDWHGRTEELPPVEFYPVGERFMAELRSQLTALPGALAPVTVHWTEGEERRITYNRKGRRADGSTYFMREQDRRLVGADYNGDIDPQVPVVVFKGLDGRPVAALLQFTGHPVTSYHPEKFMIFGDYPTVAADMLGKHLGGQGTPVPVAFLQGCAGDTSSKEMFAGGVPRAREFGAMLGQSAIDALSDLQQSKRAGMDYNERMVGIPLAPLPARQILDAEIAEMHDFVRRAEAGDENTLSCVGLNFPHSLSAKYRGALIKIPLAWDLWALKQYELGLEDKVMRTMDVKISLLRLGDVSIVGMPFEPFLGIGRRIRAHSPSPLTIPCGYMNGAYGYITDADNTGDSEYMSSFYRYTHFNPPLAKPAGDAVADCAIEVLKGFYR